MADSEVGCCTAAAAVVVHLLTPFSVLHADLHCQKNRTHRANRTVNDLPGPTVPGRVRSLMYGVRPVYFPCEMYGDRTLETVPPKVRFGPGNLLTARTPCFFLAVQWSAY